jgi:protease I
MELKGKKVIILVENMFNEQEFWYPNYRLREAGAQVTIVGSGSAQIYRGKEGTQTQADTDADKVTTDGYDAIVIPGGYAPDLMRRYPAMVNLVKEMFAAGKVVAAICHAGWMLASADVVRGKRVTSFFSIKDDLVHAGAKWEDSAVVVDGKLITSRTPDDLPRFLPAIIEAVAGQ